jgi:hypothetical protein
MARLESPHGKENGLVEPSLQAHPFERTYIARTMVQDRRRVPVIVMNTLSAFPRSPPKAHSREASNLAEGELGHILSPEGTTTDTEKLEASREWPTLKNMHEIRSFLGLCKNYRRYISGFANI